MIYYSILCYTTIYDNIIYHDMILYMYIYIYIYMFTYMYTYIYIYVYAHIHKQQTKVMVAALRVLAQIMEGRNYYY